MMRPEFLTAFEHVIGHEGGYVNDPADPGGETKFGISRKSYPDLDIRALTLDQARRVYHSDYWQASGADLLPPGVGYAVFDAAVNAGVGRAIRWLQEAAGTVPDGRIGPATRGAIARVSGDTERLIRDVNAYRMHHYMQLHAINQRFGFGWAQRVLDVNDAALRLARAA